MDVCSCGLLDRASRRHEHTESSFQSVDLVGQLQSIACEFDRIERRQLVHDPDEVGRAEPGAHELGQYLAAPRRRDELADVIFVPEDQEQPHVVACRFGRGLTRGVDFERAIVGGVAGDVHQDAGVDGLRYAVLGDDEVVFRQIGRRFATADP